MSRLNYRIQGQAAGFPVDLTISVEAADIIPFIGEIYMQAIEAAPELIERIGPKFVEIAPRIEAAIEHVKQIAKELEAKAMQEVA